MSRDPVHYFICGIGGSGMLPLAVILKGLGFAVSGSDRSYDQGRTPEKFDWIRKQGITLYPQDGSGVSDSLSAVVISKAVEDTVPDIRAAREKGVPVRRRVDILIEHFNAARARIAVSGTSGKTTTTGMIGYILKEAGMDPTVMNGGIFRNYAHENPYSTAFVGGGDVFVSEIDESDGAEAVRAFHPDIAVIHNITLDHQPMAELKEMFAGFLHGAGAAILNIDDDNVREVARNFKGRIVTYSTDRARGADYTAVDFSPRQNGMSVTILHHGAALALNLSVPGRHNVLNALAALAACHEAGVDLRRAVDIASHFSGIRRRMEIVGTAGDVTVMDDFAHNPDKVAATLTTLREFPGRIHVFFQPHGYGFLKVVGPELAQSFARHLGENDVLYMVEPFYAGGTVDRSVGSADIVRAVSDQGVDARLVDGRDEARRAILATLGPGDRVVVMGARDDTLSDFAASILAALS